MTIPLSTHDAFNPRSPWWGWMPSPVALVLHVCERCGCRSEQRGRCELCEADVMRELNGTDIKSK